MCRAGVRTHDPMVNGESQEPAWSPRYVWQLAIGLAAGSLPLLFAFLVPHGAAVSAAYDLLHAAVQMFLAVVGGATFAIQWYAASRGLDEPRGRFLGMAFLGLALLEASQLMATPGLPGLFGPPSWAREVAFWHLARVWMALTLGASAWVPRQSDHPFLKRGPLLATAIAAVAVLVAAELRFAGQELLGVPGSPTEARLWVAVITIAATIAGALAHFARHRAGGGVLHQRVALALLLAAFGEVAFAISTNATDMLAIVAHVYAAGAGWLVYDALFASAIRDPYLRLAKASTELGASNAYLERLRSRVEGELAETIGRLADSTEREAKARAELEAAIAAVPEGILVLSPDGKILRQNQVARDLFAAALDLHDDSVMNRWKLLKPRTTDGKPISMEEHPVLRAQRGETVRGYVVAVQPPGRKRTWVSVSAAPVRADDVQVGVVAAVADVSALQDLQGQLEDLLRTVSHDLRNPLQIVLLQGERLLRIAKGAGDDKMQSAAGAVIAAGQQMGTLIRDLVDAARMESGRLHLAAQPLDLRTWLPTLLSMSAGAVDATRVRLDLPPDLPLVLADPARLDRVVMNLLGNALRHSPAGREVRIFAVAREDEVEVSVQDTGEGISARDLPHVFERFYRGASSHSGEGLGLGLFIVRLLVEAHGGRIHAESCEGEGSTFSFTLPLALPTSHLPALTPI